MTETSNIKWIKEILIRKYPQIIRDRGVDFNKNGSVEGSEVISDSNCNGKVGDDEDLWKYLERNKEIIAKEVEYVSWGSRIPSDNIIHTILAIESEVVPEETIKKAYEVIGEIFEKVRARSDELSRMEPHEKLEAVRNIIRQSGIKLSYQSGTLFSEVISRSEIDCDGFASIFLSLAQEFNWPLYAVLAPAHVFIRWEDKNIQFNYENDGVIYSDQEQIDEFIVPFESINNKVYLVNLSLEQFTSVVYMNRGIAKEDLGDCEGAIKDHDEAIRLNPNYADAYVNRGSAKFKLGDYEGAVKDFAEAARLNPAFSEAYYGLGISKYIQGDYEQAILYLNEAIDINPKYLSAYIERGKAKRKLGDHEGAQIDFEKAKQLESAT